MSLSGVVNGSPGSVFGPLVRTGKGTEDRMYIFSWLRTVMVDKEIRVTVLETHPTVVQ